MTREDLIGVVISKIDEINPLGQSPEIGDQVIGRALDEAAKQILKKAKKELVFPAGISYTPEVFITKNADNSPRSVIIPLPSTFLRFLRLKMDYWKRPADSLVGTETNEYKRQYNPQGNIASVNIPSLAIVPFQWTNIPEVGAKAISSVTYADGVCTIGFDSAHGFVQGNQINVLGVAGMPDLVGTFPVAYVGDPYTLSIVFPAAEASGTGGTATLHNITGATVYTQALEAFPAPVNLSSAIADYDPSSGINATIADARRMLVVNNSSLTVGKKPIIYDLQIIETLVAEDMPDSLLDGMEWLAAGICLTSLREPQLAQAAFANATASVGNILIGMKGEEAPVAQK